MGEERKPRGTAGRLSARGLEVGGAAANLRTELLLSATLYGVVLTMADGDADSRRRWREWVEWMIGFFAALAVLAEEGGWRGPSSQRPDEMVARLPLLSAFLGDDLDREQVAVVEVTTDANRREWRERLEKLAENARAIEDLGAEPLNEIADQYTRLAQRFWTPLSSRWC